MVVHRRFVFQYFSSEGVHFENPLLIIVVLEILQMQIFQVRLPESTILLFVLNRIFGF
ncbi:hypothetical protein LEP1GSC065_2280 [Leptospira kirschneri serovar Sokoine str. RM1]|uniref:Uncharacterized protein n=1 Tax=Leptospira kirschneri str. H1 TaxID=1049966 RepID=A0A0E2B537_9LEPT|nr:hypothetical protein LEP1GSC081_1364 [Leptospira kirschneri str. H1]EMN25348.1 hypothetical protein LEP1GSC065_2280 [Leptospira kirschneri serovar Sokoine str. RM1]